MLLKHHHLNNVSNNNFRQIKETYLIPKEIKNIEDCGEYPKQTLFKSNASKTINVQVSRSIYLQEAQIGLVLFL